MTPRLSGLKEESFFFSWVCGLAELGVRLGSAVCTCFLLQVCGQAGVALLHMSLIILE